MWIMNLYMSLHFFLKEFYFYKEIPIWRKYIYLLTVWKENTKLFLNKIEQPTE